MLAALWTVGNDRCYAPDCIMPVVLEVRPGQNSQVAHIYSVRSGAPRASCQHDSSPRVKPASYIVTTYQFH